jgi:predicted NBD/HSP70 family sugar kinase
VKVSAEQPAAGGLPGRNLSGTNLERAGDHNQRVTLHAIRVSGPVTRTDLRSMTGLTAAAITSITNRLLKQRLILKAGRTRGTRGQPAAKLVINPEGCFSMGLNVDRDHITLVLVDFAGQVRARASREVKFALPQAVLNFYRGSATKLLAEAHINPAKLVGLGVAFPDDIQRAALPQQPPDYAMWGSVKLDTFLSSALSMPVFVENDAAAAAIGEMHFGLGQQYQSFFYILITAALGGGLVIDGRYYRGAAGRSGELGLLPRRGKTGVARKLESFVSLSALNERLAAKGYRVSSPRGLAQLEAPAQKIIDTWIETSVDALEDTVLAIECLINPEAVLIGGRLPATLIDRLADRLNQRLRASEGAIPSVVPVSRAALADDAPAVGAAILPFSDRFLPGRFTLMKTRSQGPVA